MIKEELLNIVSTWSVEQLTGYIGELENRITDTHALVKELRVIRKKKLNKQKNYENGPRGGM